jgi:hypothetical protein
VNNKTDYLRRWRKWNRIFDINLLIVLGANFDNHPTIMIHFFLLSCMQSPHLWMDDMWKRWNIF